MKPCRRCREEREDCTCDDGGDFIASAIIGAATDSTIIGGLLGGDFGGAALGDGLNGGFLDDDGDWD